MSRSREPQDRDVRLQRLLGGAELAPLRLRMRRHFERRESNAADGVLHLSNLSPAEHETIASLTGRPSRYAASVRLDIGLLNAALRDAGIAGSLQEALEIIDGPIVNRAAVRAEMNAAWSAVIGVGDRHPALTAWLSTPGATGLLKRLTGQDTSSAELLLNRADAVLRRLPADGLTRAQLAAEALGNAHALDKGQPTATLVLTAWRHFENSPATVQIAPRDDADSPNAERQPDERTRETWARAGVLVNELARPALFLNLPNHVHLAPLSPFGEPGYLSLRRLLRTSIDWPVAGRTVFVCENPNIVSIAADRLGTSCGPLVCTEGMPAAAQRVLLTQLAQAGASLKYHGDFDWAGLQIANHVIRTYGARAWRFGRDEYTIAVKDAPHVSRDLGEPAVVASWDATLTASMEFHGLAIPEEAVVAALLIDLESPRV